MPYLDSLLSIASAAEYPSDYPAQRNLGEDWGMLGKELVQLLSRRNGFYAFESALHVYGVAASGASDMPADLVQWNSPDCWRSSFGDLAEGYLFFAEDIFGGQFAISRKNIHIVSFDPETAQVEVIADSVEGWARAVLEDFDYLTGRSLAHSWQARHGALERGYRLLPKLPFVAGGKYELGNLYAAEAVGGMKFRGGIATQIVGLPEGAKITFRAVE